MAILTKQIKLWSCHAILSLVATTLQPALADQATSAIVVKQKHWMHGMQTFYLTADKLRWETKTNGLYAIADLKTSTVYLINKKTKSYCRKPFSNFYLPMARSEAYAGEIETLSSEWSPIGQKKGYFFPEEIYKCQFKTVSHEQSGSFLLNGKQNGKYNVVLLITIMKDPRINPKLAAVASKIDSLPNLGGLPGKLTQNFNGYLCDIPIRTIGISNAQVSSDSFTPPSNFKACRSIEEVASNVQASDLFEIIK